MNSLKWFVIVALAGYGGLIAVMYFTQRALMYFPETARTPPAAAGLAQAEEIVLTTADGERIIAWHVPPRGDKPVMLYFHGNGASLRYRVERLMLPPMDGARIVLSGMEARRSPSEAGLIADAGAGYAFAAARYPADASCCGGIDRLGVEIALAAKEPVRASRWNRRHLGRDVGAALIRCSGALAVKDQFRADELIGKVRRRSSFCKAIATGWFVFWRAAMRCSEPKRFCVRR